MFAWWLFLTRGGYCAMRRSKHITGFHWMWSPDLKNWLHYAPSAPKPEWWKAMFHKLWFEGRVKRGDKDVSDPR